MCGTDRGSGVRPREARERWRLHLCTAIWRKLNGGEYEHMYSSETNSRGNASDPSGVRGVFEDGRHLGSLAALFGVRARGVLRFVQEQTCDETFSRHEACDHEVVRAWRGLGLVLR